MTDRKAVWEPPSEFDGFQVTRLIGAGGMGRVYQARDPLLERDVAVKFIAAERPEPSALERFLIEARAVARLQHPNVVSVYRVGEVDGRPYVACEFVAGKSLDQLGLPLPWREVLRIASGLTRGLAAAQSRGILHRDIKPGNIMVSDAGEVKLVDFGIAKLVDVQASPGGDADVSATAAQLELERTMTVVLAPRNGRADRERAPALTRAGTVLGTPRYLAPELWHGSRATLRSDVFSLGVVLYELCVGTDFRATPDGGVAMFDTALQPLAQRAPGVPAELARVIDRCVAIRVDERFGSAEEVRDALEQVTAALEGSGPVAVAKPRPRRPSDPHRRAEDAALPERTLLAGRYLITGFVGRGGAGAVYTAHDDDLDEDIALKVLRHELARDAEVQRRLKAEMRLARRVSHPNVCRVHDLGVDDELVFVTMELVRGRTLRERLTDTRSGRADPFDLAHIVDIVLQIGAALSAAHRIGVTHGGVKPDNVILADDRTVLADFGVASLALDRSRSLGTPAYLAPELLRDEPFDHRVDVYALACMTHELIAGAPPYALATIEQATKLASERQAYPGLPEGFATPAVRTMLDRALARGLDTDPLVRSATVERFTDAFAHAARSAPLSTALTGRPLERPSLAETTTPPLRQSRRDLTTPPPLPRRTERRVTTALVWHANRGTRDTEIAERMVVDAGGTPIRVASGDIIALFGATRSMGDDAARAAHVALELVAKFGGRAALDTTRILLRHIGNEVAGPDSASAAAALARDAAEGEVWASSATARQLAARFDLDIATGDARRVLGVRQVVDGLSVESLRGTELAAIERHLERAFRERKPVFVEVCGAEGSGKTQLRKAIVDAISARREVEWLIALASPAGEPAPLSIVQSCSPEWYEATIGSGAEPAKRDHAARRWLEERAMQRPVVVIADDLQWADPTSLALLEHLRTSLDRVPVAVLTFVRGEQPPAPRPGVEVVALGPLDGERATLLARSIAATASDDTIAEVVKLAAGNPFFIEELARELDAGARTPTLPASIEAVVQARLDQLPPLANQVAIAAAVVGHGFWRRTVARLMPTLVELELDAALADLERGGLIAPAAPMIFDDEFYQFASHLVREVAYARIPPRERRLHHGVVAAWLDEQPRTAEQEAARVLAIAHHREQAGDAGLAAAAYRLAGKHCLELFAYGEATSALKKAAALVTVPDPQLEEDLGDALAQTEGYAAAEPAYQRALDETEDDDAPARARLLYKLGAAASKRGVSGDAIARFEAGLALAAPGDQLAPWAQADPRIAAQLWAELGWTLGYRLGRVDEGHPYCQRAIAVLEPTPYRRELAHALSRLGGTYMRACRFPDQLRCNQRNLEIGIELNDLNMQLTANVNLGVVYGLLGDIDDAVAATKTARALAAPMGAMATDGLAASNLAGFYIEQGKLAEADALLDESIAFAERSGHRYYLCESFVFRARIAATRGDIARAREHAERSLALARTLGNELDAAIALRVLAQLDSRAGDHEVALQRIEQALVQAVIHDEYEATRTRAARARILAAAKDPSAPAEFAHLRLDLEQLGAKRELEVLEQLDEVR